MDVVSFTGGKFGEPKEIINQGKDFAASHGVLMRRKDAPNNPHEAQLLPFTLFPSPYPKNCFYLAKKVQKHFNILMHKVAHDHLFLARCLSSTIKVDDFTGRLWGIYENVMQEGTLKVITLAMNRSDYMLHYSSDTAEPAIKQVEFNTMAAGFGGVSPQISQLHRYLMQITAQQDLSGLCHLPDNNSCKGLAEAIAAGWKAYGTSTAIVVFLVLPNEANIYDQRHLQFAIEAGDSGIKVIRRTLTDFSERGSIDSHRKLFIDGHEVAVLYQRCGYSPEHFKSEAEWKARLMIERSLAVTCPSINYHLAGTKKVQQVLCEPGEVERFLGNTEMARDIRSTFVNMYGLDRLQKSNDNEGVEDVIQMALNSPKNFVLKPQREGGGNNFYNEMLRNQLLKIKDTDEISAYILMERIFPKPFENILIRQVVSDHPTKVISELGIFGTLVSRGVDDILLNESEGHILRTKRFDTDEGGVATGYSFLDSPLLL